MTLDFTKLDGLVAAVTIFEATGKRYERLLQQFRDTSFGVSR